VLRLVLCSQSVVLHNRRKTFDKLTVSVDFADTLELVLIGLHAQPDTAVEEMEALVDVHAAVEQEWNTDDILILGDVNADCTYATATELAGLTLRTDTRFTWLIGDDVDTTTTSTDCAYDRCV